MPTLIRRVAPVLVMSVLFAAAAPAIAQERLPGEVVRADGTWSTSQRDQVNTYISRWADQLLNSQDPQQVAIARAQLVEPLTRPGGTASFKDQYSQLLAGPLRPGLAPEKPIATRLNALVVVGKMVGGYGLDLILDGLDDPNAAVRYWAGKAAAENLGDDGQNPFDPPALDRLLNAITPVLNREGSWEVREQLYLALAAMPSDRARSTVLNALQARVAHYVQNGLELGIRAERRAMGRLYPEFVRLRIDDRLSDQLVRELVVTAGQYAQLIRASVQQNPPNDLTPVLVELSSTIEQILPWGVKALSGADQVQGPPLADPLQQGQLAQFALNVLDWVGRNGTVVKAGIGVTAQNLTLPPTPDDG